MLSTDQSTGKYGGDLAMVLPLWDLLEQYDNISIKQILSPAFVH